MLTKEKGDCALGQAIRYFLSHGYKVCLPIGDKRDYDLVIEKHGNLDKVQVKFGGRYASVNQCKVALRIMGGNRSYFTAKRYSADSFDLLFVYTASNKSYLIPWQGDIIKQATINIEAAKYKPYLLHMQG